MFVLLILKCLEILNLYRNIRFEFIAAVTMKNVVFSDVTLSIFSQRASVASYC
jgi:hypothetical protein